MSLNKGCALTTTVVATVIMTLTFLGVFHRERMVKIMTRPPQNAYQDIPQELTASNQRTKMALEVSDAVSRPSRLTLIDLTPASTDKGECMKTKTNPVYNICIYDPKVDTTVSAYLKKDGSWEGIYLPTFQKILTSDPELGFLDIGANIGPWGLLAATMGHKTILVEPFPSHIEKLRRSIQLGQLQNKTILVQNSISDKYNNYSAFFPYGKSNLGALRMIPYKGSGPKMESVLMNDLVPILPFNRALMKLDLEGFEDKALAHSDELFKSIFIPYVLMEWAFPKYVYGNDKERVMSLINSMMSKGYKPYAYGWKPLNIASWPGWPLDIVWRHNLFQPLL